MGFFLGYGAVKRGGGSRNVASQSWNVKIFLRLMKKSYGSGTNIQDSVFRWFVLGFNIVLHLFWSTLQKLIEVSRREKGTPTCFISILSLWRPQPLLQSPIMLLIIYRYHLSILHHTQIKIAPIFSLLLKLFSESMNRFQLILGSK